MVEPMVAREFSWNITALLVSPCESERHGLEEFFMASGWQLECAPDADAGLAMLNRIVIPVVICQEGWHSLLRGSAQLAQPPRVIVASGSADEALWSEVIDLGGYRVLATPVDEREAFQSISLAWHSWCRQWKTATTPRGQPHAAGHRRGAPAAAS